jgi:hypothetical protein
MHLGQQAASVEFLVRDRAGQFTGSFDAVLTAEGIRILASSPQAASSPQPRQAPVPPEPVNLAEHRIRRRQVLGGLTHQYYVAA